MKLLIAYATTDGMTARIAERIAEKARAGGCAADAVDAAALPKGVDPARYDGILVGASMHAQGYQHAAAARASIAPSRDVRLPPPETGPQGPSPRGMRAPRWSTSPG